nr:DUF2188 domain-containing protein [Lysobacter solisilvae]
MSKKDIHVVPRKDGWAVVREGGDRAFTAERTRR